MAVDTDRIAGLGVYRIEVEYGGGHLKTYSVSKARAQFSKLIDKALAGDPQRVTRYGKEAVVIVSEQEWRARVRSAPTLGALLARYARSGAIQEDISARPWKDCSLGNDLE
jgi:prevent-host-death family protein